MPINAYGIDTSSSKYASKTFAAATRDQWNMYLTQFGVPQENLLIEYAMNDASVSDAVGGARQNVREAYAQQPGIMNRQMRSLGVELNADEQKAATRSTALNSSLAEVNAGNMAADRVRDRQMGLLGAPMPNIGGA